MDRGGGEAAGVGAPRGWKQVVRDRTQAAGKVRGAALVLGIYWSEIAHKLLGRWAALPHPELLPCQPATGLLPSTAAFFVLMCHPRVFDIVLNLPTQD